MASKLDQAIARVAIAVGSRDCDAMMQVATEVASQLSPKDIAKIPDKWYPAIGAKKAGVPDLDQSWQHVWFEALTEILFQKKEQGLSELLVLMDRDDSTHHSFAILRLLRLAADNIESETILKRVRRRLMTLQHVWTRQTVREVVFWTVTDRRPLELLKTMSDIIVPNMDGDTVWTFIEQISDEFPIHLTRAKEHGI